MNRRTWLNSFLIALASPSQAALARTQPVTRLDDVLEPLRAKHGLPALAGAVVSKGQIAAAAVGARLLNTGKKVTVNDRFHLGSDTKAMTATLAGMAVEAGKLRWDTTIGDALGAKVPGIEPRLAAVTLEQLLSHSGGIPSDTDEILNLYFSPDASNMICRRSGCAFSTPGKTMRPRRNRARNSIMRTSAMSLPAP